jgi:site-specific recombinase XerD
MTRKEHPIGRLLEEQFRILSQTLKPKTIVIYRAYANSFPRYLEGNHPQLEAAQLRRDPHILGWLQSLAQKNPPLSVSYRLSIITLMRRLLNDLAENGYPFEKNLIVPRDIPSPYPPKPEVDNLLAHDLYEQIQTLSTTLRPGTIASYRTYTRGFLRYLNRNYPEVENPAQLKRNPHILGWLRSLAQRSPPFANGSRLHIITCVRRLLSDLANGGHPVAENLIIPRDFPPKDMYLPKPVSPEVDELLKDELRKTDDLLSNALLLIRATGMRVGECVGLRNDCLRHLGGDHWALHVPLGKLHNERLVPMDKEARGILDRIISLSGGSGSGNAVCPLVLTPKGETVSTQQIREALKSASQRVHCQPVVPHQLRHTYATMMVRAGISLPALKEILGHRDIRMTMRYVQVTQIDLQREYFLAREKMANLHVLPQLPTDARAKDVGGISSICTGLDEIKHQLQMYLRQLGDQDQGRKLHALLRRLLRLRKSLSALIEQQ